MNQPTRPIFFTSDLHVGHQNVIIFDKRPFKDLDHMHEVLINNYNSTVPKNGICYFLGDVGLGSGEVLKNFISRLNGTKVLILGNHDKSMFAMYDRGFDVVLNSAIIYIGDNRVSLSHCPLPGIFREDISEMKNAMPGDNWHGESKNIKFTSYDDTVDFHLHGHIHSTFHNGKPKSTDRQYDVGVAANDYRPVSMKQILSWIQSVSKSN